jgi:hypothetical protein
VDAGRLVVAVGQSGAATDDAWPPHPMPQQAPALPLTSSAVEVVVPQRPLGVSTPVVETGCMTDNDVAPWNGKPRQRPRRVRRNVIPTRPSRLSPQNLCELLRRGAQIAGAEPARSAVTVGMFTISGAIEVHRTVTATATSAWAAPRYCWTRRWKVNASPCASKAS